MSRFTKICLSIAAVFAVGGVILCVVGAAFGATIGDVKTATGSSHISSWIGRFADWDWNWDDDDSSSSVINNAYSYDKDEVKNLDIAMNAGTLTIGKSSSDKVEVNVYLKNGTVDCGLNGDTLQIEDHTKTYYINRHVEVELLLPDEMQLEDINIDVAAGEVDSSYENLAADKAVLSVDAGEANIAYFSVKEKLSATVGAGTIELENLSVGDLELDCGVGEIDIDGSVNGDISGSCGVGTLSIELVGEKEDYNYSIDCGIGEIAIDNDTYSSLGSEKDIDHNAGKDMALDCGVGTIRVEFK